MRGLIACFAAAAAGVACGDPLLTLVETNDGGGGSNSTSNGAGLGHACPRDVGLPPASAFEQVVAQVVGSTVRIEFPPVDDARDYRVYALPKAADVTSNRIAGGTYRCAGLYEIPETTLEDDKLPQDHSIRTRVDSSVEGYRRSASEITLGYVYTVPEKGRIPVYALGDPALDADEGCSSQRYPESRVKRYTASATERASLVASHWRDDGVAFYVPEAGANTHPIYETETATISLYVSPGAELDQRRDAGEVASPSFNVLSAEEPGTRPLMRVYYQLSCARGHDELVVGAARFEKAYRQGAVPVPRLHWSGLSEGTTLVVEALDRLCPFQGMLSPTSRPSQRRTFEGNTHLYPAFLTENELRATNAARELFIGGQGPADSAPKAVSRVCIDVAPKIEAADWRYESAKDSYGPETSFDFQSWQVESDQMSAWFYANETKEWAVGPMFDELWMLHADFAAGTTGKVRMTPKSRGRLSANTYLHATMAVDSVATNARFPELIVSDRPAPIDENLPNGGAVVVYPHGQITTPLVAELRFCDHTVDSLGCPGWNLQTLDDGAAQFLAPHLELNAIAAVDATVLWELYVSTERVYVLVDGKPYGCADLPAGGLTAGPATVTFGSLLMHSAIDLASHYRFHMKHSWNVASRHFSNLSFRSDVSAPAWDETLLPCVPATGLAN